VAIILPIVRRDYRESVKYLGVLFETLSAN
jgi:hypothetical protein